MNGLSDALTIGILLILVFGAVCFYLYSRLSQNEKRMSLMENLLVSIKMSAEADGPNSVEPVSSPEPLSSGDVDEVDDEEYEAVLKDIPTATTTAPSTAPAATQDEEDLLRSAAAIESIAPSTNSLVQDINYETMSVKELQSLARQKGLAPPQRKREIIDLLKKNNIVPENVEPLKSSDDTTFQVNMDAI